MVFPWCCHCQWGRSYRGGGLETSSLLALKETYSLSPAGPDDPGCVRVPGRERPLHHRAQGDRGETAAGENNQDDRRLHLSPRQNVRCAFQAARVGLPSLQIFNHDLASRSLSRTRHSVSFCRTVDDEDELLYGDSDISMTMNMTNQNEAAQPQQRAEEAMETDDVTETEIAPSYWLAVAREDGTLEVRHNNKGAYQRQGRPCYSFWVKRWVGVLSAKTTTPAFSRVA